MQPGWSRPQRSRQAEAPEPLQRQLPAQPLLSQPNMERKAEINRFAIFLFCLLVPLGSLAPTEISESKVTAGQRQKRFITNTKYLSAVIQDRAHELFQFYNNCVSDSFHREPWTIRCEARDMAEKIPDCPAFHANCCVFHDIHNLLQTLQSSIETLCYGNSKLVRGNIKQLNSVLTEGRTFYSCRVQELPQIHTMHWADKKTYIWWVLKRYEDIKLE